MPTPTPQVGNLSVPETLELTNASAYVPYPLDGIREGDPAPHPMPTVGLPTRDKDEFRHNSEERCAIVLVLDKSASMAGERVRLLNEAVAKFKSNLTEDSLAARKVDVAVNEFNNLARFHPFRNATQWQPPIIEAAGGTHLSYALGVALDAVTQRKDEYRLNGISYHRPWIVVLTDGRPELDSEAELDAIGQRIREASERKHCSLFVITCGEANTDGIELIREKITPPGYPPKKTTEANFSELFQWLSDSQTAISRSTPGTGIQLEDTSGWEIA